MKYLFLLLGLFVINCAPPTAPSPETNYACQVICDIPEGGVESYIKIAREDTLAFYNESYGQEITYSRAIKTGEKILISIRTYYNSSLCDRQIKAIIYINGKIVMEKIEISDREVSLSLEYIAP